MTAARTPAEQGFSMPAEWEKHDSTWLSWPKNPLTFAPEALGKVEDAYVEMVDALARGERVDLLVDDEAAEGRVRSVLSTSENVVFHRTKSADVWMRDYGPIFVKRGREVACTKWRFNAWGGKYDDLLADDQTGAQVARSTGLRVFEPDMVLEGGSIDVNGAGTLLTTAQCLLNKNRNPHLRRGAIEGRLREFLGVREVVWLGEGVAGDDTDGHVDDIARFVGPDTVVCMAEKDQSSQNHKVLKKNFETLAAHKGADETRLNVVPIQMPSPTRGEDQPLPASYANFYIGNVVVLLPVFGDRNDDAAISTLSMLFPGREVVPVDCRELVSGFGGIHCVTQQQPSP